MKYRIAAGAIVGFVVAGCWALYAFARPVPITDADPTVWILAGLTQPLCLLVFISISAFISIGSWLRMLLPMRCSVLAWRLCGNECTPLTIRIGLSAKRILEFRTAIWPSEKHCGNQQFCIRCGVVRFSPDRMAHGMFFSNRLPVARLATG